MFVRKKTVCAIIVIFLTNLFPITGLTGLAHLHAQTPPLTNFAAVCGDGSAAGQRACSQGVVNECSELKDDGNGSTEPTGNQVPACSITQNQIVTDVINPAIKVFSILVGVVAVIMLIAAGIIYSSSQDDPKRVALAKKIIVDVIIGIAAYVFLYAFLNYVLPQGVG